MDGCFLIVSSHSERQDRERGKKGEGRGQKRKKREENMLREERRGIGWNMSSLVLLVIRILIL